MRRLPLFLGVPSCTASAALAGPNAGGVLWVHDTGLLPTDWDIPYPPVSAPPADCASVDNHAWVYGGSSIWKVYAAFPQAASPRLMSAAWGTQFTDIQGFPYSYVVVQSSACGAPDQDGTGTDVWTGALGFPSANGGEVTQSFPTGPRTGNVVALF